MPTSSRYLGTQLLSKYLLAVSAAKAPTVVVAKNRLLGQPVPTAHQLGVDERHHLLTPTGQTRVLPGHLAR